MININFQCIFLSIFLSNYIIFSKNYKYWLYDDIFSLFSELEKTCPDYIKIDTSQNRYNLDSINGCGNNNCTNLIVFMTDFNSYTINRPVYYISGLLHGDEVMGPTSITEFALYFCKENRNVNSLPHSILKNKLIIFTPMTNAYGYYNRKRDETVLIHNNNKESYINVDPNRDFPYFKSDKEKEKCMRTLAARTINEIFNEFIVTGSLTFHGGDNVIGYAWGNYVHLGSESPDTTTSNSMGEILVSASASEKNMKMGIKNYILGDMSKTVYPINGGLEDWAYGGSWDNYYSPEKPIKKCISNTFSPYNEYWDIDSNLKKDIFYDYKLRCIMFLVEASMQKIPKEEFLGYNDDIKDILNFEETKDFYGHVIRNIRLMYTAIDFIHSHIYINPYIRINKKEKKASLEFKVMGCINVEKLEILRFKYENLNKNMLTNEYLINVKGELVKEIKEPKCYWKEYSEKYELELKIDEINDHNKYIYFIKGTFPDKNWLTQNKPDPKVPPQSHITRSKSNKNFKVKNGNFTLNSNYYFVSYPIILGYDEGKNVANLNDNSIVEDIYSNINIVDDIDALLIENKKSLEIVEIKYIENDNKNNNIYSYIIDSNVEVIKKYKKHNKNNNNNTILTSDFEYDMNIDFEGVLVKENKELNIIKSEIEFKEDIKSIDSLSVKIGLNFKGNDSDKISLKCQAFTKYNKNFHILCQNIFSGYKIKYNITYNFIRNSLLNSVIFLKYKNFSYIGQFAINGNFKGKTMFNNGKNNKLYCILNNNYYDMHYNISFTKKSHRNIIVNIGNKPKITKYWYFILIFPYYDQYIVYDYNNITNNYSIFFNDDVDISIIGKIVYAIKVHSSELDSMKDIMENIIRNDNDNSYIIRNINNNKNKVISKCSMMTYSELLANNFSNINIDEEIPELSNEKFYFLYICIIIIIITVIIILLFFYIKIWRKIYRNNRNNMYTTKIEEIQMTKIPSYASTQDNNSKLNEIKIEV